MKYPSRPIVQMQPRRKFWRSQLFWWIVWAIYCVAIVYGIHALRMQVGP